MMKSRHRFWIMLSTVCLIGGSIGTVPSAAQTKRSPVAPTRERVEAVVREAYEKFRNDTNGKNADYIPYLAHVDSKLFGIALVSTDNQTFELGDVKYFFSIQSISKVYSLALAMEELGPEQVFQKVGSEPTGRVLNSPLVVVDMPTHIANPLVDAGTISTVSLINPARAVFTSCAAIACNSITSVIQTTGHRVLV
jgi:glutaminase